MYTDSKLFCIQQLSMDLFLIQLFLTLHYHPAHCPFPEAPPWCLWDSAMPCGGWLELSVSGMGQPQPLLTEALQFPQPVPGHGHMAQWLQRDRGSSCPPGDSPRDFCSHEGKLNCGDWTVSPELWWSSEHVGWAPDTHTATKAHSYYSFPNKAGCLYFTALSLGRMLHWFDGMLHFIHQWFFSVRRV